MSSKKRRVDARKEKFTCLDLFCGAGGFSAGFREAGFNVVAGVDCVPVYVRTHTQNFPESVSLCADITKLDPKDFARESGLRRGKIDVIIGSPPCQTFSSIGIPKINSVSPIDLKSDPRNYLFKHFLDYVKFYRPAVFVMENVPSMATRFKGRLFERLLAHIDDLGYEVHSRVFNSAEWGVPQIRRRLFVIGTRGGVTFAGPSPTHYVAENGGQLDVFRNEDLESPVTVYDAISDLPLVRDGNREDELPYSRFDDLSSFQVSVRNTSGRVRNNICRMSNERAKRLFPHMTQGGKYMDLPEAVRRILPFREDIFYDRLKRLDYSRPSWTVIAHIGMDGYMYIHPSENRTLSVREAARLQSFNDAFVFHGNMREQYIQVGNAVPPLLARTIARSLREVLE